MIEARCGAVLTCGGCVLLAILAAGCGGEDPAVRIDSLRRAGKVEALAKEADAPDGTTARLAVRALGSLGPKAVPHLERILGDDERGEVREMAALALGRAGDWSQGARLVSVLRGDESPMVRAAAATALGHLHAVDEVESLLDALDDADPAVRRRALDAFNEITRMRFILPDAGSERQEAIQKIRAYWREVEPGVQAAYYAMHAAAQR